MRCFAFLVCVWGTVFAGCRYDLDRLYALPLESAPTEADWEQVPPYRVRAVGGRTTVARDSDVDSDAVHVTTASCHHGAQAPPVAVDLRAFWTKENLYLRVEWTDPTENRGPLWSWNGVAWRGSGPWEDGLGLLWGASEENFHCARYCHLSDWRVAGVRALADYAMATADGVPPRDFWVWRAGREVFEGVVEDGYLGSSGRRGDGGEPQETYVPNSQRHAQGKGDPFGVGDSPRIFPRPAPGAISPGFLRVPVPPGRTEVVSSSRWRSGKWELTVSRLRKATDAGDVHFVSGKEYAFGLAVLDAVDRDHLAVPEAIRLLLVEPETMAKMDPAKDRRERSQAHE